KQSYTRKIFANFRNCSASRTINNSWTTKMLSSSIVLFGNQFPQGFQACRSTYIEVQVCSKIIQYIFIKEAFVGTINKPLRKQFLCSRYSVRKTFIGCFLICVLLLKKVNFLKTQNYTLRYQKVYDESFFFIETFLSIKI